MTTLVRLETVHWTVLAAGLSVAAFGCGSDEAGQTGPAGFPSPVFDGESGEAASPASPSVDGEPSADAPPADAEPAVAGASDDATPDGVEGGGLPTELAPGMPEVPSSGGDGPAPDDEADTEGEPVPAAGGIDDYNPDFEEFVGADCELPEPTLLASPDHSLPDPFLMADGSRMSALSEWACQRAWLKKNIEAFVHGTKPGTPDVVTGSVSTTGVQVHVEQGGNSADFGVSFQAGGNGPSPAMFQADGSGVPGNFLTGEGVVPIPYSHAAAEGAFNSIYGNGGVANPIKWAWAVSRVIDVLVAERDAGNNDVIDPTALGVTGCSYAGKSAFVVGAYDERIALGIPVESGTGGLGSYRVVGDRNLGPNGGEDPEQVSEACGQNWLTSDLCSGNVDRIPADAHFLVAMYAPRGFTTLDNNRIGHLGPVAQFTADAAGAEVFKALGVESHVGYHGGNDTDPHNHCSFNPSQQDTARRAIQGFLTKTAEPANFMEPKLKNQGDQPVAWDLASYVNWDAPTLQ